MQPSNGTPDPVALAVAQAAQNAVHHSTIILFGSRAASTHRPDSDVDLMLVYRQSPIAEQSRAQKAVKAHLHQDPPHLRVDIVPMELRDFNYCRRANNHVAAQALRKGIIMSSEKLDFSNRYEDEYPACWPDVKWRLQATYRNLGTFQREFLHPEGEQESYCFHAQQAVENSLKAWISAAELDYSGIHDLDSITQSVLGNDNESQTLAAQQLRMLLEYTTAPDPNDPEQTINWLSLYGAWYRYRGASHRMTEPQKARFVNEVTLATHTFINRAQELTGTNDGDLAR